MTDDQFWRITIGGAVMAAIPFIKPAFMRFMYRIGYKDMKWRKTP